jgi:hypothetical protein
MNNLVDNGKLMVEDICKKIWSLKILQKIKAFHSRAARVSYPNFAPYFFIPIFAPIYFPIPILPP